VIVVIQCAARKRPGAGHLASSTGVPVTFVANLATAPPVKRGVYARPDDLSDTGTRWRDVLREYNATRQDNPRGLYRAHELYDVPTYGQLVRSLGEDRVYILSAGWASSRRVF
jgi:hypothetical protein